MTPEQESLIVQFKIVSAEASSIDGCDMTQARRLPPLDSRLRDLTAKLEATGLHLNDVGEWV
jgi:hypothetical protein